MGIDNYIDGGLTGEARRRYDCSHGRTGSRPRPKKVTAQHEAELGQVDREKAELRKRLLGELIEK